MLIALTNFTIFQTEKNDGDLGSLVIFLKETNLPNNVSLMKETPLNFCA